jgi:hypothetical protein
VTANRRTLPQTHRLVACAFTPSLALPVSLYKKNTSLSLPLPPPRPQHLADADVHSPHAVARPIRHGSLAPVARAGAAGACSTCRTLRPPGRAKPGVGSASGSEAHTCRWCWMLVVLARRRSPPITTRWPELIDTSVPSPLCCKYIF